jgi:RNA polymerase sigma-70 factor (ECF subfamily)
MPEPTSLAVLFASRLPRAQERWPERQDSLEERLRSLIEAAASAWPQFDVPPSVFVPFLAERISDGNAELSLEHLHASELYLVCACLGGDGCALAAFEREILSSVDRALARLKLGERVEDIKQRVRQQLFVARPGEAPKITGYSGRGKLAAFVRVVAVREAIDLLEKERHEIPCDPKQLSTVPSSDGDPELGYMKRTYRAAFKEAFERAFLSLAPRAQNLLRQQLIDGLTVTELGALYQVHHATAARWLVETRKELIKRTRKELKQRLRLSSSECDSILRLASSHLEPSISRLLRGAAAS